MGAGPSITAIEKSRRYLIWWITIIKYNLKPVAPAGPLQACGHDPEEGEPVFGRDHAQPKI
jgi:hypothetical protein